ncbi:hypothetical protein [Fusobacterium ulcerans]|uniref:hypothetical protein n=1 Tax=Fusobacterium ulcerans TaxID=861 RepID=UPI0030B126D2
MTRDELRKFYTFLKKETGIEGVPSRNLGSKEEVLNEIRKIIKKTENTFFDNWVKASEKNIELKSELENLKNKKWWQIWK